MYEVCKIIVLVIYRVEPIVVEVDDVRVLDLGERLEDPLQLLLLRLKLLRRGEEGLVPYDLRITQQNHNKTSRTC